MSIIEILSLELFISSERNDSFFVLKPLVG